MTKEQYYEKIKEIRSILANPDNLKCTCPNVKCEWHGDCQKCVAQHRYFKKHIPNCLQVVFNDKIKEIVQIFEMTATENEKTPNEYWDYVREADRRAKQA
jgi:hypothetical protein